MPQTNIRITTRPTNPDLLRKLEECEQSGEHAPIRWFHYTGKGDGLPNLNSVYGQCKHCLSLLTRPLTKEEHQRVLDLMQHPPIY